MNKISAKHFMLFIFGVTCISFKTYPSLFIQQGGRDTWLYALLTFFIFLAFAMYIMHIISKKKVYNINEIFTIGLGKSVGMIFLVLFAFGLFLSSLEAASVEANVIKSSFFLETPTWYIILFFIIPSVFLVGKNVRTLLTFILITVSSLVVNTIVFALITEKYKDIKYIMPVFSGNIGTEFFYTSLLMLGTLSSFVIALPYLRYLGKEDFLKKHSLIAFLMIGALCVYTFIGILATFGPLRASNLFYPEFTQSQRVQIGGFIEFGEFFFLYQTVVGFFIKYILCMYGIYAIFKKYIKNYKYYNTVYSIAIFIFATFLSRNNYIVFYILKYFQYINIILFIVVPLIAFTAFNIKYKKSKTPSDT